MINRQFADMIYQIFVNKVPGIRDRYKRMRYQGRGRVRVFAWLYLAYLNVAYHVFRRRRLGALEKYPYYETKILYAKGSESSLSKRKPPGEFALELAEYDVVSFDVFDTLILRPFSSPADLFFLQGDELGYMDFKRIRMEMEHRARQKKHREAGTYEVSLDEIYTMLADETGIEKENSMRRELELEEEYCFANPYMLQVVKELQRMGKRPIVISDMYLSTEQIQKLLKKCGFSAFSQYYVSCDTGSSKSRGDLYDEVRKREETLCGGRRLTFVHVGDNVTADVQNAKKHGFESRHYVNVNEAGRQYRPRDMSEITGSVYRGIVNAHIHNGIQVYSREYEYGFIYGGLFVTGYCQFIHEYAKSRGIEKLLFLARDGYVLKKAYEILYPKEKERCVYVYWSRLAAAKMTAAHFKYDYFRRFLYHKVNQGYAIKDILASMELENMTEELCKAAGVQKETELTDKNVEKVRDFLMEHWGEVLSHYAEQIEAGKQYFTEKLEGCKSAAAVDIGWAGSGAVTLEHMINRVWGLDCALTGIIAGTNTCHNAEPDASETFLQSGKLASYMYSQRENRDIWKFHDPGKGHNLYWELLLDAPHGSLKGFYIGAEGKWECRFKSEPKEKARIKEIQKGILAFTEEYKKIQGRSPLFRKIAGRDAYAPMVVAEGEKNEKFFREICGLVDEVGVG